MFGNVWSYLLFGLLHLPLFSYKVWRKMGGCNMSSVVWSKSKSPWIEGWETSRTAVENYLWSIFTQHDLPFLWVLGHLALRYMDLPLQISAPFTMALWNNLLYLFITVDISFIFHCKLTITWCILDTSIALSWYVLIAIFSYFIRHSRAMPTCLLWYFAWCNDSTAYSGNCGQYMSGIEFSLPNLFLNIWHVGDQNIFQRLDKLNFGTKCGRFSCCQCLPW